MKTDERRVEILKILEKRDTPISASALASIFGVTRQIIVKDMGVIKAEKKDIISTARGYILNSAANPNVRRTIKVSHSAEDIEDELNIIVDLGGYVVSTAVEHSVYGTLGEMLNIKSRKDIKNFILRIKETGCEPLLRLTQGKHMHVIEAEDEESIDEICRALEEKGYIDNE